MHERLKFIGADTAESRAAAILSGLQFSESMQHATTNSLSGGWRMRVALAGALFIEPGWFTTILTLSTILSNL